MSVQEYLVDQHSVSDTDAGIELRVAYLVTADELDSTATPHTRLHSALGVSGIPARGSAHPTIPGIQVLTRDAVPAGKDHNVIVTVVYGEPRADSDSALLTTTGVVSFFSSVRQEQTNRDNAGNLMTLSWTGTVADVHPESFDTSAMTDGRPVTASVSRGSWGTKIVKRIADLATAETHYANHHMTVNNATWSGYAARTWLLSNIEVSGNNTTDLRAMYTFLYKADTWDFEAVIRISGKVPQNVDTPSGNGIDTFEVYPSSNFATLGVSF